MRCRGAPSSGRSKHVLLEGGVHQEWFLGPGRGPGPEIGRHSLWQELKVWCSLGGQGGWESGPCQEHPHLASGFTACFPSYTQTQAWLGR